MLIVPVDDNNIEKALRKFKAKTKRTQLIKEINKRQAYVKPSVKKRQKRKKAFYVHKKYHSNTED